MSSGHAAEVESGSRFAFGDNWSKFLAGLSEDRVGRAEQSLRDMLKADDLRASSFSTSGREAAIQSRGAAARGNGSFLRLRPAVGGLHRGVEAPVLQGDPGWIVEQGSVLDEEFMGKLGRFDIVYSWGVLHHTGQMYKAFSMVIPTVAPGGHLFISVYNDQGFASEYWLMVKRTYNKGRWPGPS